MFKRLHFKARAADHKVTFTFNEQVVVAHQGDTVASALLANNLITFGQRSGVNKSCFCMMGACYECLVQINGRSVQACMVTATQDMQVTPLTDCTADPQLTNNLRQEPEDA